MKSTKKAVTLKQKKSTKQAKAHKATAIVKPIAAPSAMSKTISRLGRPKINRVGDTGDVIVIHREYITDLLASATAGAFSVAGIPINPGNIFMFPWLSQMAKNFESYLFKGLKFLFEPDVGSQTAGSVLLAVDYDVSDSLPADKQELMSFRDATRSPMWVSNSLHCAKEDLNKRKSYYVNSVGDAGPSYGGTNPEADASPDQRLDDVGELLLATSNAGGSSPAGEIYVEYEVHLMTPTSGGADPNLWTFAQQATSSNGMTIAVPGGLDTLGGASAPYIYDGLPIEYFISAGKSALGFRSPGTYLVTLTADQWTMTSGTPGTSNYGFLEIDEAVGFTNISFTNSKYGRAYQMSSSITPTFNLSTYVTVADNDPDANGHIGVVYLQIVTSGTANLSATAGVSGFIIRIVQTPPPSPLWNAGDGPRLTQKRPTRKDLGFVQEYGSPAKERCTCTSSVEDRCFSRSSFQNEEYLRYMAGKRPSIDKDKEPGPVSSDRCPSDSFLPRSPENRCILSGPNSSKISKGRVRFSDPAHETAMRRYRG